MPTEKPLSPELQALADYNAGDVAMTKKMLAPIKLPTFTFIIGCSESQSEAIAGALTEQDNSLYLESFRQPIIDAVHSLLDATGFDGLLNTPEWDLEIYEGADVTPKDLAIELEQTLRRRPFIMENLLASRVLANEGFNQYQYIIPDATGFSIYEFLRCVKSSDAIVLVGNLKLQQPAGVQIMHILPEDPVSVVESLRLRLGTL